MLKKTLSALAVAGVLILAGAGAASADPGSTTLSASPSSIEAGETSVVTATPLADGETAYFSVSSPTGGDGSITADEVVAAGGQAQTTFTATVPGRYTVNLGDGETDYAFVEIVVTAVGDPGPPALTANPGSIAVGELSLITASPLEADFPVVFSSSAGGTVDPAQPTVVDGAAQTQFSATAPGRYTVFLGDGVNPPIARVEVVVTAAVTDPGPVVLTASSTRITVGQTSTITASPLEDGFPARFATSGAASVTPAEPTAAGGQAQTTFSATAPGTYTVFFGDRVNPPIARIDIVVVAATLPVTGGEVPPALVATGVAAVVAGLVTVGFVARRRTRQAD